MEKKTVLVIACILALSLFIVADISVVEKPLITKESRAFGLMLSGFDILVFGTGEDVEYVPVPKELTPIIIGGVNG